MSVITYSRIPQIDKTLSLVLTDNGYLNINNAPFLNQFMTVIKDAIKGPYNEVYSISSNIDIGRARGQYLDRWGRFLNQSRSTISYASDLSLSNVEIYIYGTNADPIASAITIDANDIIIPSNTILTGSDKSYVFRTIDNVKISGDKNSVFVRVIAETEGAIYIPSGYLTNISLKLNEISNIMPIATTQYQLKCRNNKEISGGTSTADDATYSYMLQETAASLGLSNDRKINNLYDIENAYDIKLVKFRGGISVFIDATDISLIDQVIQTARNHIKNNMNFGTPVYCFPPTVRTFKPIINLVIQNKENLGNNYESFKTSLSERINKSKMGSSIQIQTMIDDIISTSPGILSGSMKEGYVGGRKLLGSSIELMFNERVATAITDITVVPI